MKNEETAITACFILFFVPHYFLSVCFGENLSPRHLASTLFPVQGSWYSGNPIQGSTWYTDNAVDYYGVILSSRNIHCRFTCTESCNNTNFFSVFLFAVGEYGMVWSANRDHPSKENATIAMTKYGDLMLRDSDGTKVWSTDTSGKSVMGMNIFFLWYIGNSMGMNITEVGNLVLFDNTGGIVWQSFDDPTDTLVEGQRLHEG
ncbi:G-type lectin S-receptor-like serine/threonine-protein kinase SD2-5 [Rhododendron vialii]|uniref:G-type lectin S-receptor-like serine/threonine-protein kinase SD2-5 n=1 Tax=Rhododendron vialii TaxID=182163 RepID=UPI00265F16C7|nr:G-type lectin S-receptor-like serine/threonine-protein kinase SD2-5 [Rhododendron vialii]